MAQTDNLIMGAGELYTAPVGTTEPDDSAVGTPPGVDWNNAGYTKDGVSITYTPTYTPLEVDQEIDVPAFRLTSRDVKIVTNLAEVTLDKISFALNNDSAPATGAGYEAIEFEDRAAALVPTGTALIFDGIAPGDKVRRVIARKAVSLSGITIAYKKAEQTVLSVEFTLLAPGGGVKLGKIVDEV